jgi:hypothetical protein
MQCAMPSPDHGLSAPPSLCVEHAQHTLIPFSTPPTAASHALLTPFTTFPLLSDDASTIAALGTMVQLEGSAHMMRSLYAARSMTGEVKLNFLAAALARDTGQQFGRQLLREIVYGAMLRLHQQLHPELSQKAQIASFRTQLCNASACEKQELMDMHSRWSRLAPLLQCEEDDYEWAIFAANTPAATYSKVLNRDKMIALAKRQTNWKELQQEKKYAVWRTVMKNTLSAAQVDTWVIKEEEQGQLLQRTRTTHNNRTEQISDVAVAVMNVCMCSCRSTQ